MSPNNIKPDRDIIASLTSPADSDHDVATTVTDSPVSDTLQGNLSIGKTPFHSSRATTIPSSPTSTITRPPSDTTDPTCASSPLPVVSDLPTPPLSVRERRQRPPLISIDQSDSSTTSNTLPKPASETTDPSCVSSLLPAVSNFNTPSNSLRTRRNRPPLTIITPSPSSPYPTGYFRKWREGSMVRRELAKNRGYEIDPPRRGERGEAMMRHPWPVYRYNQEQGRLERLDAPASPGDRGKI